MKVGGGFRRRRGRKGEKRVKNNENFLYKCKKVFINNLKTGSLTESVENVQQNHRQMKENGIGGASLPKGGMECV